MRCTDVPRGVECAVVYGRALDFGASGLRCSTSGGAIRTINRNHSRKNVATHPVSFTSLNHEARSQRIGPQE